MNQHDHRFAFGVVPSRRLGNSLGINSIPYKTCSYDCSYCQVGPTVGRTIDRRRFFPVETIIRAASGCMAPEHAPPPCIDFITIVPDGEPTLDAELGSLIEQLHTLSHRVAVITNGSLLWREDVREDLMAADWISVKIDTIDPDIWRRINRPHESLDLTRILEGISRFAQAFTGTLVTETMLVDGFNHSDTSIENLAGFIRSLHPSKAYLSIPIRPPVRSGVRPPDASRLTRVISIMAEHGVPVVDLFEHESDPFQISSDLENQLLGITAVHPIREEALLDIVTRSGMDWEVIRNMIENGLLIRTVHNGHVFYRKAHRQKDISGTEPIGGKEMVDA